MKEKKKSNHLKSVAEDRNKIKLFHRLNNFTEPQNSEPPALRRAANLN